MSESYKNTSYADHINSPEWLATRQRYWDSDLPQECYVCAKPRDEKFHMHHRTYKNFGKEELEDIVPACPRCHRFIHNIYEFFLKNRKKKADLWRSTDLARRSYRSGNKERKLDLAVLSPKQRAAKRRDQRMRSRVKQMNIGSDDVKPARTTGWSGAESRARKALARNASRINGHA